MKKLRILLHLLFSKNYVVITFKRRYRDYDVKMASKCHKNDLSNAAYIIQDAYLDIEEQESALRTTEEIINSK